MIKTVKIEVIEPDKWKAFEAMAFDRGYDLQTLIYHLLLHDLKRYEHERRFINR